GDSRGDRAAAPCVGRPIAGHVGSLERPMHHRVFGRTGWNVGDVGYGMWGMGGWTGSNDDESMAALERAVDLGCNFFDTAWAYGQGHSERLLGRLLRSRPATRV